MNTQVFKTRGYRCYLSVNVTQYSITLCYALYRLQLPHKIVQCIHQNTQLDMLRQHKPPPIRRIRISDFGLPDLKRDPDRHQNCITWSLSHALPLQKISSKSVHKFASNLTDRQTNRPHRKHNLLLQQK